MLHSLPLFASRAPAFLAGTGSLSDSSYMQLLMSNVDLVLRLAGPFAANQTVDNLVHLRPSGSSQSILT